MAGASELVVMDDDELELRLAECRKELFNLRFQLATGQLDNTARMAQVRKDVARILTVMRDREIQEAEGTYVPPPAGRRAAAPAAGLDEGDALPADVDEDDALPADVDEDEEYEEEEG